MFAVEEFHLHCRLPLQTKRRRKKDIPVSISVSCSRPSSCAPGLGLRRPGDDRGVIVDASVSGPIDDDMSGSEKQESTECELMTPF